ncbi:MAG: ketopantoate reductase C-terminal domain-containing protein, partial [Planctomycetota bacterium]|nr:ketopantoate reductase C-terminal domain-containing protein [Planctomycetota bacterium]
AVSVPDASRWKYGKLLLNLGNAVDAFGLPDPGFQGLIKRAVDEGRCCLRAANLGFLATVDLLAAMEKGPQPETIDGQSRRGGSTWQSAARGLPLETDHLNGWIVELGLRHGVPTPVNQAFVRLSKLGAAPRSVPLAQVQAWAE